MRLLKILMSILNYLFNYLIEFASLWCWLWWFKRCFQALNYRMEILPHSTIPLHHQTVNFVAPTANSEHGNNLNTIPTTKPLQLQLIFICAFAFQWFPSELKSWKIKFMRTPLSVIPDANLGLRSFHSFAEYFNDKSRLNSCIPRVRKARWENIENKLQAKKVENLACFEIRKVIIALQRY